jgi:hypothetical protein
MRWEYIKLKTLKELREKELKNLARTWLEFEMRENEISVSQAVELMNYSIGGSMTESRVMEMADRRNGRGNKTSEDVRYYMMTRVMESVLGRYAKSGDKLTKYRIEKICEALS